MVTYVSHSKPIGIDIESIKDRNPKIERKLYTQNEITFIESGEFPNVNYFKVWTMKESYTKFLGMGLNLPLSSFDTTSLSARGYYYTKTINNYVVTICTEDALKLHVETINLSI
jgi:phosphopantetheinyl transferase